jgi:hypothetical protein
MQSLSMKQDSSVKRLFARSEAQNLTEYALAVAVIGLASVAGMRAVAIGVNHTLVAVTNAIILGMPAVPFVRGWSGGARSRAHGNDHLASAPLGHTTGESYNL